MGRLLELETNGVAAKAVFKFRGGGRRRVPSAEWPPPPPLSFTRQGAAVTDPVLLTACEPAGNDVGDDTREMQPHRFLFQELMWKKG
ncbi:unnamed protein product [Merluccius merluccius]